MRVQILSPVSFASLKENTKKQGFSVSRISFNGSLNSVDTFCFQKTQQKDPVHFKGIGYFFSSSKGRKDLSGYFRERISGIKSFENVDQVNLPDLKDGQKIDRIILHWTATNKLTPGALTRYHYSIDNSEHNKIYQGAYSIADNARQINDNQYAAHVFNGNSHSIGIALIGMKGASSDGSDVGNQPITEKQLDQACKLIARIIEKYNLPLNEETITTHYEFGVKRNDKNKEKADIRYLPWDKSIKADETGAYIRTKVRQYLAK